MFALPIPLLIAISVVTLWIRSLMNGHYSKNISKGSTYLTWVFTFFQNVFCVCTITGLFLISGGLRTFSSTTIILGVIMAIVNVVNQYFMLEAFKIGPFSYTIVITSLSAMIPALSGLFFGETITTVQIIGMIFVIVCILLSPDKSKDADANKANVKWLIFTLFAAVTSGATGIIQKIHQSSPATMTEMPALLIVCFGLSTVFSFIFCIIKREKNTTNIKFNHNLWTIPALSGIFFAFPHTLNLFLSGVLDAIIFFPTINLIPMIMSMVMGMILFKEKLSKKRWCGIIIGIIAVILVSGLF